MALRTPAFNDAKSYGFEWLRYLAETGDVQEGVVGQQAAAADLKVSPGTGGGQRVDVAAGAFYVKGDSGVPAVGLSQGLFLGVNDAIIQNAATLNASDPSNPRIDQICLQVQESSDLGTGADQYTIVVLTGVPTAGATLDNRNGALALGNDKFRLADVLIPAGSAAVTAGNIRDRRPWARGACRRILRNSGNYSIASVPMVNVDSTNVYPRIECSGVPLRVSVMTSATVAAGATGAVAPWLDGAAGDGATAGGLLTGGVGMGAGWYPLPLSWTLLPTAASHLVGISGSASSGTLTLAASAATPLLFLVEEILRQNADNT